MPLAAAVGTIEFSILIRLQTASNRFLPYGRRLRPTSSGCSLSCACSKTLWCEAHLERFAETRWIYACLRIVCTRHYCEKQEWWKSESRLLSGCLQRGGRRCQH